MVNNNGVNMNFDKMVKNIISNDYNINLMTSVTKTAFNIINPKINGLFPKKIKILSQKYSFEKVSYGSSEINGRITPVILTHNALFPFSRLDVEEGENSKLEYWIYFNKPASKVFLDWDDFDASDWEELSPKRIEQIQTLVDSKKRSILLSILELGLTQSEINIIDLNNTFVLEVLPNEIYNIKKFRG